MAKQIILIGFFLVIVGGVFLIIEKNGVNYNNPLDFKFEKGNTKFYFPLGSSILISVVLSLIFYFSRKI
ncbi:MAG: hypothetical protein CMC48_03630 [Flavobacteriaceae bacterium]|nr:hypothetical protein [Flavobacteriaceae bacterium]|tara:strand:- start:696 stop:902 length:207 start_codon:yes stop_codon:yes gene_type:complete